MQAGARRMPHRSRDDYSPPGWTGQGQPVATIPHCGPMGAFSAQARPSLVMRALAAAEHHGPLGTVSLAALDRDTKLQQAHRP
jgi:hypothetical protein